MNTGDLVSSTGSPETAGEVPFYVRVFYSWTLLRADGYVISEWMDKHGKMHRTESPPPPMYFEAQP